MEIDKVLEELLFKVGVEVVNEAKSVAPVRSGNLKNDIHIIRNSSDFVEIGNSKLAPYARYVHEGTKPYVIVPKRKKALKTPYGVFKKVNHPGIEANPYLLNGLEAFNRKGGLEKIVDSLEIEEAILRDLGLDKL